MRAFVIVAILALAALPLPSASAAEPLLTDAAGDVQFSTSANGVLLPTIPGGSSENAQGGDLLSLQVAETMDTLVFTLAVVSFQGEPSGLVSLTRFDWGRERYALEMGYFHGGDNLGEERFAALLVEQGTDWEYVAVLDELVVDVEGATLTASVPKAYVLDEARRIPGRGDAIQLVQVISETNLIGFDLVEFAISDAMPDSEGSPVPFTLALGDHAQGEIVLTTPERVRVSNGGATTFVFALTLRNLGDAEHEFALATADLPDGWNATLRSPVKVPPKEEKVVSLLLSVPFAHEHGGYSSFNVTAESTRDAGTNARMRLGVLHTPIPQPAGHHSELFLHARDPRAGSFDEVFATTFPFATGWMNTQEDHAEDAAIVTPRNEGDGQIAWYIPLNPSLQMGLDFDVDETGTLEGTLLAGREGEAEIAAELIYYREGGDETLLVESDPVSVTLAQQGSTAFKLTMLPLPEADYIAYAPDAGLYLRLSMAGADVRDQFFNTPLKVQLETQTFKLALPLLEYHDRLDGAADVAQAITITAKGLVEKAGRPGSVLTYPFTVRNDGAPDTLVLDLAGNDVAHAYLVPQGEVQLATGETREVTLAVELPVDANIGQEYEVLLFVHARDDPSKMAVARTKTRATDVAEEAMADESAELLAAQARENKTPGGGVAALGLALAIAVLLSRRR